MVYDYDGADGPVFCGFLMERMDGALSDLLANGSFRDLLEARGFAETGAAEALLHVLCEVLPCVAVLHALGVVHRDLHAGNILVKVHKWRLKY